MSLVNKLVNPTPFNVKLPYEKGIELKIPADGQLELTIEQMDDYRPGKPGSEEVRKMLSFHGVFLMDVDRSYDSQALTALETSLKEKKKVVEDFIAALKTSRTRQGYSLDPVAMQEVTDGAGYGASGIGGQITALQKRVTMLKKVVQADDAKGKVKETLDPTRTCYVTKPPREFPSKIALAMFLEDNPDIKKKHEEFTKASA